MWAFLSYLSHFLVCETSSSSVESTVPAVYSAWQTNRLSLNKWGLQSCSSNVEDVSSWDNCLPYLFTNCLQFLFTFTNANIAFGGEFKNSWKSFWREFGTLKEEICPAVKRTVILLILIEIYLFIVIQLIIEKAIDKRWTTEQIQYELQPVTPSCSLFIMLCGGNVYY